MEACDRDPTGHIHLPDPVQRIFIPPLYLVFYPYRLSGSLFLSPTFRRCQTGCHRGDDRGLTREVQDASGRCER